MKYYIYLLVLIGSILMVNQHAIAQTTVSQTEQFQNRIVDSIFSKTLSESRGLNQYSHGLGHTFN